MGDKMSVCKITVFTPTYNRAYTITKLYESLCGQTYRDFEWLVIDDGSTDHTEDLFENWQQDGSDFSIRYYKKVNEGKARAVNDGLDKAQGELFFVVDSDDVLTPNALEKLVGWEEALPKDQMFCGVSANKGISSTQTPNTLFETPFIDTTFLDQDRIDGERALVFYTAIHRRYRYPSYEGETFMTEAVVYNRMAHDGYKMRFHNDIVCIYEYREDGLTRSGMRLFLDNPRGYGLWLKEKQAFTDPSFKAKCKLYYSFMCDLKDRYDTKRIAACIGAPRWLIAMMKAAHTLLHRGR